MNHFTFCVLPVHRSFIGAGSHKDAPLGTHIFVAACILLSAVLVAYASFRLYDLPVREWLKKKLFKPLPNK
ncbi:hypothetical protein QUW14_07105 [Bacteroides gallinaceum]|uniref:hypothetical protein n=1 Tax=Bacteroides gallinaceum TaxID=1462571 RepID=UPI0025A43A1B|nr:hypothetical protein [Bacteroides gallinaceum]MDM8154074.1 hypothetical protein [Bacteroides gallinaceum]